MKRILIYIALFLIPIYSFSQKNQESLTVMFYNVENLYDTINDPLTLDDDFTPLGKKNWKDSRYQKKLNDIAKVISSVNENNLPVLVGFAELENKTVLQDLIQTESLKTKKYKIVHEESPDVRGIDVGLIYNSDEFQYLNHLKIPIPLDTEYKVRDILYIKGVLKGTDTLHVFINHWKSRSGGQEETEPQRIQCALTLKNQIDSILAKTDDAKILIMGDLNDEPKNKSIFETLKADNSGEQGSLYNLMLSLSQNGFGTHSYRGGWNMLDHIIVSSGFINCTSGFKVNENDGQIFSPDWITFTSKDGNKSPNRTYGGSNYYGGYSDHYPVFVILKKQ
ncbi:MAG TPA: endonuclease [Bacteroidales bacterium]|nr:endonuclease [Bacteroidales bacterium]